MQHYQKVCHKKGDSFIALMAVKNGEGDEAVPADLTGYTVESQIRRRSDLVLIQDLDPVITDAAAGEIRIDVLNTDAWPTEEALWDLKLVDPAGVITSSKTIIVSIESEVTYL